MKVFTTTDISAAKISTYSLPSIGTCAGTQTEHSLGPLLRILYDKIILYNTLCTLNQLLLARFCCLYACDCCPACWSDHWFIHPMLFYCCSAIIITIYSSEYTDQGSIHLFIKLTLLQVIYTTAPAWSVSRSFEASVNIFTAFGHLSRESFTLPSTPGFFIFLSWFFISKFTTAIAKSHGRIFDDRNCFTKVNLIRTCHSANVFPFNQSWFH